MKRVLLVAMALLIMVCCSSALGADDYRGALETLAAPGLALRMSKGCGATYLHGETVTISIESSIDGYLTIIDFQPDGRVNRVFPNQYQTQNYVLAGNLYTIPGILFPYSLQVAPPDGEDVLLAVVTSQPYNVVTDVVLQDGKAAAVAAYISAAVARIPEAIGHAVAICHFCIGACSQPTDTTTVTAPLPAPPSSTSPENGKTYGLLVCISDYADNRYDLDYPIAQNILDAVQRAIGGWLDAVTRLDNQRATRAAILGAIRGLAQVVGPEDTVYFHFAGHGYYTRDGNGDEEDGYDEVIVPYDGEYILDDELWDAFGSLQAKRVVLVFESCHSGTAERSLGVFALPSETRNLGYVAGSMLDAAEGSAIRSLASPRVLSLQACGSGESAYFLNRADGLSWFAEGYVSAFTGSRHQADADGDGWVSFQEAFAWTREHVRRSAETAGEDQTPQMSDGIGVPVKVVPTEGR